MKVDFLHLGPGPKELVEKAAIGLVSQRPEFFSVNPPLDNDYLLSIIVKTTRGF